MNFQRITKAKNFKKMTISTFVILSILFWFGMWLYGRFFISTDDAYVNAHVVQVASRVTGQVNKLNITNNQYIQQGTPLFEIDPDQFKTAFEKAEAQVAIRQAELANAQSTAERTLKLVSKKFLSPQEGDNRTAALKSAVASLKLAQATLEQANLDLKWTTVTAPTSGWVTNVSLREGNNVAANQPLFALISDKEFWIDANFKETQLESIKPGQAVTIKVDMYPDHAFKGVVESISGGAGSAFSLLPPQNATGNWVKITQRVPVRIRVLNPDPTYPLRIGTSSSVTISLHKMVQQEITNT